MTESDNDEYGGAYLLPPPGLPHPADVAAPLLELEEHRHLIDNPCNIKWLMRRFSKVKAGRQILGSVHMPRVNGELSDMFEWMLENLFGELPDFLVILDLEYWTNATPVQREILTFHELLHAVQAMDRYGAPRFTREGLPVWALRGHDVEEFTDVVARYGAHNDDIKAFIAVANGYDGEGS